MGQCVENEGKMRISMYFSAHLSACQQNWHPFKQELYGQKKAKAAFRKMLGQSPRYAWTDHANLTRLALLPLDRIEPLHFRWYAELTGDGCELLAISGRSQLLAAADAISRNHERRDELMAQRTEDISTMRQRIREFNVSEFVEGDEDPTPADAVCVPCSTCSAGGQYVSSVCEDLLDATCAN